MLQSLTTDLKDSDFAYEINILDNDSGDILEDVQEQWPICKVYYADTNGGFGAGHNQLTRKTNAEYLLLLNPDTLIIKPQTLKRLLDDAQQLSADVVGPALLTLKDRASSMPFYTTQDIVDMLRPQAWDHGELKGAQSASPGLQLAPKKVAWVSGAVALVAHDAFDKVGGFDENFFLYKEEEDLFLRMRRQGGVVIYDPSVHVMHYGSVVASKDVHFAKSQEYFRQKHGDMPNE